MGEQVVAEEDRLAALQVGEPGDQHVTVALGEIEERGDQPAQGLREGRHPGLQPQAHVGRDLVVAGPGGVQASAGGADQRGQTGLDGHVDVLVLGAGRVRPVGDLGADAIETGEDRGDLVGGEQPDLGEHGRVRLGAGDVLVDHPEVDRQGLAEQDHVVGRGAGESSVPQGHVASSGGSVTWDRSGRGGSRLTIGRGSGTGRIDGRWRGPTFELRLIARVFSWRLHGGARSGPCGLRVACVSPALYARSSWGFGWDSRWSC